MIYLYSPTPPLQTGTADYFDAVILAIVNAQLPLDQFCIVVDQNLYAGKIESFRSIRVVDSAEVPGFASDGDLRFYFTANNTYHSYIHRSLSELHVGPGAAVVVVVHEPSCFMLHKHEAFAGMHSMSVDQLERNMRLQYGAKSRKFLNDLNAGHLPNVFDYVTLCSSDYLCRATEIWTHSSFAACKLLLESNLPAAVFPTMKVLQHPHYHYGFSGALEEEVESLLRQKAGFRIGTFGWVSESKRTREAIAGLAQFLDRMDRKDHGVIDMVIVGKLPPRDIYDLQSEITRFDLQDHVKLYDFVPSSTFRALVRTCDLILNLRYPSCGESSGAIAHARGAQVMTMTSRCQAFAEEESEYSIPALPGIESQMIASGISDAFERWARGTPHERTSSSRARPEFQLDEAASVDSAIAARCAIHLARSGIQSDAAR